MTREDTAAVLAVVRMLWPHSNLGGSSIEVLGIWHAFLEAYQADEVEAAIRELAAQGREFAPPVGVVVKALAARETDFPEWDEVRAEIIRAVTRYRPPRGAASPYEAPPHTYWSHPLIAEFMAGAWDEWRMASEADGTFNAQQREAWKALAHRTERGTALHAVGAPRRRELGRFDFLKALPGGAA